MDQGIDRGIWIVCGPGALIHTLCFDLTFFWRFAKIAKTHDNPKLCNMGIPRFQNKPVPAGG